MGVIVYITCRTIFGGRKGRTGRMGRMGETVISYVKVVDQVNFSGF